MGNSRGDRGEAVQRVDERMSGKGGPSGQAAVPPAKAASKGGALEDLAAPTTNTAHRKEAEGDNFKEVTQATERQALDQGQPVSIFGLFQ